VLAVPARDPRYVGLTDLVDVRKVSPFLLDEIEHFFAVYKEVEPGKETEPGRWEDAATAARIVDESRARFTEPRLRRASGSDRHTAPHER
jgi:inorganic pyrophosphatase